MLLVLGMGWGVMANAYATEIEGYQLEPGRVRIGRGGRGRAASVSAGFFSNAIGKLPDAPAVIGHAFREAAWIPIGICVLEGLIFAGGFGLKAVEKNLAGPPKRRRR